MSPGLIGGAHAGTAAIASRVRQVREELFGHHGSPALARLIGVPARTWDNYELGVTIPGRVMLGLLEATGAEPGWLLTGRGPRYRARLDGAMAVPSAPGT